MESPSARSSRASTTKRAAVSPRQAMAASDCAVGEATARRTPRCTHTVGRAKPLSGPPAASGAKRSPGSHVPSALSTSNIPATRRRRHRRRRRRRRRRRIRRRRRRCRCPRIRRRRRRCRAPRRCQDWGPWECSSTNSQRWRPKLTCLQIAMEGRCDEKMIDIFRTRSSPSRMPPTR